MDIMPIFFGIAGGIIGAGLMILLGVWLRDRLGLTADPPPELQWQAPPPAAIAAGDAAKTRRAARARIADIGQWGWQCEVWEFQLTQFIAHCDQMSEADCVPLPLAAARNYSGFCRNN